MKTTRGDLEDLQNRDGFKYLAHMLPVSLEERLNKIDYSKLAAYTPSQFALEFVNLIKLIHNGQLENKTPIAHYQLIDSFYNCGNNVLNMCHRGFGKSVLIRYLFWYIAIYGEIPRYGDINFAMYVTDTIENGVRTMRNNLEFMYNNSKFLQKYVDASFTESRWVLTGKNGHNFVVRGFGVGTGMRGLNEYGVRPQFACLDDLFSSKNAESPTIVEDIQTTIYDALRPALHPTKRKIIWLGTPFNKSDPLYTAISSGEWYVNVFPVCERFPCKKSEFKGAWEDRFDYDFVKREYNHLLGLGKIGSFNKEMMLRLVSNEDRLIPEDQVIWYDRDKVINDKKNYNFYITTDFASSTKQSADYSVISVWAYSRDKEWLWVDGICKRQKMDTNIEELFRLVKLYRPQQVGIEVSGQQQSYISWLKQQMVSTGVYFVIARNKPDAKGNREEGFRSAVDKMSRLALVLPFFATHKIKFPKQLEKEEIMIEAMDEIRFATNDGLKSKHDDFLDTISQIPLFIPLTPTEIKDGEGGCNEGSAIIEDTKHFPEEEEDYSYLNSYIV